MKKLSPTGLFISSKIGKAIKDYDLIQDGDKILVAVSGDGDSLSLLTLLKERQRWAPVKFELIAVHIESDARRSNSLIRNRLKSLFKEIGVNYKFKKIKVCDKNGKTNCFWCAWNRRRSLFETAVNLGCNKIALGHHMDDIIETTLLNLFFQGEFSTMNPHQELFNGKIAIIRPMCYVEKDSITRFANENGFIKERYKCPNSKVSNRTYLKKLIKDMEKRSPNIKKNIFRSIARIKKDYINLKEDADEQNGVFSY